MDPQQQREILFRFIDALPPAALDQLSQKNLDIVVLVHDIGAAHEFVLYEMGNICEGVRRVLAGEDSASNLVAFIQKDERIEEDNRPKIPALAYEIQQKIFDPVLPILKQAGFPIKEGRVAPPVAQPTTDNRQPTTGGLAARPSASSGNIEYRISNIEKAQSSQQDNNQLNAKRYPPIGGLNANHIRALVRIAAGTKYGEEELRETFEELPVGLRQSLSSVDTANAIQGIAKKYLLHVDQMASLASETGLVLLGLTHLADFVANLARRLRLPEAEAKEIARDISAEIFVKVREALRGIHEENPKSEIRNPKQISSSNIQNINQGTTPAVSEYGTPFGKGELKSPELSAKRYPLNASSTTASSTPYSPQAKWNTGDNILAKQAAAKEGPLSREEVLREIESPTKILRSNIGYQISDIDKTQTIQQGNNQLNANRYTLTASSSTPYSSQAKWNTGVDQPPTTDRQQPKEENILARQARLKESLTREEVLRGIEYPTRASQRNFESRISNIEKAQNVQQDNNQLNAKPQYQSEARYGAQRYPPQGDLNASQKSRPQSESAFPPQKPKPETEDFLEQKLQKPMTAPREERRYTTDPYREPLE